LPLILYRGPIRTADAPDPAALFEVLFDRNGWKGSWRDGIYDYVHYHSQIHEVLGIARGQVTVRLGGSRGRAFKLKAGDVAILPAGRDTSGSTKAMISSWLAHIPRLESTISAAAPRRSTSAP
jgi:uncharacterized protein YjlB